MSAPELVVDYAPRAPFVAFHHRTERFACIVTHRRAGKTVACIHDLQLGATQSTKIRPRFAYLSPFLKQSKAVAWDYLRAGMAPLRAIGASAHETELRVDYPNGGQVRLYGADNPDALRGSYLDGIVLDEYADMDPRVWSEIIRTGLGGSAGLGGLHRHAQGPQRLLRAVAALAVGTELVFLHAQGERDRPHSRKRARARQARSQRGPIRPRVRMLVRRRDRRLLLREADGAR